MMRLVQGTVWAFALIALVLGILRLEGERSSVEVRSVATADGPVLLYHAGAAPDGPLVVVTHGFAGSLQMMQYISRDLARAGFTVAAFDFYGHGRNGSLLSPDVTRIEGTTQQLVQQTQAIVDELRGATGASGRMGLVGHSMATDIIIRAARARPDVAAIVAISMYSDAITADFPQRLLVLSGSWEERLRVVGRAAVAEVGGEGVEGVTVTSGEVLRRAVAVPRTEHVAVLFATLTQLETRSWLGMALGVEPGQGSEPQGLAILAVLAAITVLIWPLARLLPERRAASAPVTRSTFWSAVLLPVLPALAGSWIVPDPLAGMAGFGSLMSFLAVWGAVALTVLMRSGYRPGWPRLSGVFLLLFWGLAVFAFALDRYGAAFLPTGSRLPLMLLLLPGCALFMLADRGLVHGAGIVRRVVARLVPVASLSVAMSLDPRDMGLLFTVLPVMILFFLVYGTMGRAVARRCGPETAAAGQAIILAWAIAASTPLFSA